MQVSRTLGWTVAVALLSALAPASAATAAPVVPGEVAEYIATELVDDLNDFYGPGTEGNGRLFTNTTTTSTGVRVFEFTADFVAGVVADPPVRRVNQWVSVISIDKSPVGFAIVFIDPVTTSPQLESFTESADFGEVVLTLPETAVLVRDTDRAAWFSLDEEELTPIVAGTSGVEEPIGTDDYRQVVADQLAALADAEPAPADDYTGLILAGLILVLIILLLAIEAFLPHWHRRLHGRHEIVPEHPHLRPHPHPEAHGETKAQASKKKAAVEPVVVAEAEQKATVKPNAKRRKDSEAKAAEEAKPAEEAKAAEGAKKAAAEPAQKAAAEPAQKPGPKAEQKPEPKPRATPKPKAEAEPEPEPEPEPAPAAAEKAPSKPRTPRARPTASN